VFGIVKAELLKLFRRKGFLLLFVIVLLPFFYSICTLMGVSYITNLITLKIGFFNFCVQMMNISCELLIFPVFIALCAIQTQRGEIDNRSIRFYLQRVDKRSSVYLAKHIVIVISILLIFLLLLITCLICYYAVLSHQTKADLLQGIGAYGGLTEMALLVSMFLYFTTIAFIGFSISTTFSAEVATGITALVIVLLACIKEVPVLQILSPTYYIQQLSSSDGNFSTGQCVLSVLLLTISVCLFAYRIGCQKFARSDI